MKYWLNRSFSIARCGLSFPVVALGLALAACASAGGEGEDATQLSAAIGSAGTGGATCKSTSLALLDLHGDVRELWKGLEQPATGKQAEPNLVITLDFNATVTASSIAASFVPTATDGSCGGAVAATATPAVVPADTWGQVTSDVARQALPSPFNLLVRDRISGLVSAGGPIAAGKDVTLSSLSVNGTIREPVGLIAGGKVTLTSGSVAGDVTYGVASTFPQTVSISGKKTLLSFDPAVAFGKLESLSTLLDEIPLTGSATLTNGTLTLAGTKSGVNSFRISADQLRQASTILISAPSGAGVLIGTSGSAVNLQNKGISLTGVTAGSVLWNFPAAGSLNVSSTTLQGSVLAPRARLEFGSGGINGTVVARSFVGSGSGSLQYTPLNVTTLLGAAAPSSVALTPAQPLTRGCSYRLAIPSTTPLNAAGACLGAPFGVTFGVAPHLSTPAGRELIHVERDLKTGMLRRFSAKSGVNTSINDVWARYESAPGVSAAELVAVGPVTKSSTVASETVQAYQQYTQGYPVVGFGYFVASENGFFRSANGRVMPSIPSLPQPSISAATALQNALTYLKVSPAPWVAKPTTYQAPTGSLVVIPKRPLPLAAEFALVWAFQLGGKTGIAISTSIQVDAMTGVVRNDNPSQLPATLNPLAKAVGPTLAATVTTAYYGTPSFTTTDYKNPDTSTVAALSNGDVFSPVVIPGLIAATTGVYKDSTGNYTGTESYLIDPTPSTPWVTPDPLEQGVASAQWAVELGDSFMKTLNLSLNQHAWSVVDGSGTRPLFLNYVDPAHVWSTMSQAFFRTTGADTGKLQLFARDDGLNQGMDIMVHEYAHALFDSARRAAGLTGLINHRESASILEGLGDLFTIAFNQQHQDLASPWYCYTTESASDGRECLEDAREPYLSILNKGQPEYYLGDHYANYIDAANSVCSDTKVDSDNCGAHWNSTIVSHWAYLLAAGSSDMPSVPCDLHLDPVVTGDPAAGLKLAVQLSMAGVQRIGAAQPTQDTEATFYDFRDATLEIAQEGLKSGLYKPEDVAKVERAWAAMALPAQEPTQSHVEPLDGSEYVNPWTVFTWPASDFANSDGTPVDSWDFQLADGPWDTNLKLELPAITTKILRDGVNVPTVSVSLPYDTTTNFYWRVRPHSTDVTWLACYPVHTFKGTSHPSSIENFKPVYEVVEGNTVRPGTVIFDWDTVPGATGYVIDAATSDPGCKAGTDVLESKIDQAAPVVEGGVQPLDAAEHYYVGVHANGPPGFDKKPTTSDCVKLEIDTAAPAAPETFHPVDNTIVSDRGLTDFIWAVAAGTAESQVSFYELDEKGKCATVPTSVDIVTTPCTTVLCEAKLVGKAFPKPNLTGYCWQVEVSAKNGTPGAGPSLPLEHLRFFHRQTLKDEPGIDSATFEGLSVDGVLVNPAITSILPGDSYGQPVTLSWEGDPDAIGYGYRVWPFGKNNPPFPITTVDPSNCSFQGIFGPVSSCCSLPTDVAVEDTTSDPAAPIEDGSASSGRYCWNVWPLFANPDPTHSTEVGPRQPFVVLDREFCYTSGPSTPEISIDNPPGDKYSPAPITGHIKFDYVPDNQFAFECTDAATGKPAPEFSAPKTCTPPDDYFVYADIHDCDVPFSITPVMGKKYTITAHTWNSDEHPPVMDAASALPDKVQSVNVPSCGKTTELCCDPKVKAECDEKRNVCDADHCMVCGTETHKCCKTGLACDSGFECNAGTCTKPVCTKPGEPDLLTLAGYQSYCPLNGNTISLDTDLDLPACTLSNSNIGLLVTNHVIPCSSGLSFLWSAVPGADHYEVYVYDYLSETPNSLGNVVNPGFSYPNCTLNLQNDCIDIPISPADPGLLTFAIRAVNKCGQKGPAGVGMIALRDTCH